MLEFFYCGWQGRQTGLKRWGGGGGGGPAGGGRRGGAFGYLARKKPTWPITAILTSRFVNKLKTKIVRAG